jgi:hypothetical protein
MSNIRDNKKLMGGIAAGVGLLALIVLARGLFFAGDAGPSGPTQADLDAQALIQSLQEANPPPRQPVDNEPPVEPGSGRKMQLAPS